MIGKSQKLVWLNKDLSIKSKRAAYISYIEFISTCKRN